MSNTPDASPRPRNVSAPLNVGRVSARPDSLDDAHCARLRSSTLKLIGNWMWDVGTDEDGDRYFSPSVVDHLDARSYIVIRARGRFQLLNRLGTVVEDSADLGAILSALRAAVGLRRTP